MLNKITIILFICLHIRSNCSSDVTDNPIINLKNGRIRGQWFLLDNKLFNVFKGIPYAVPPVGELRFRKPVPIRHEWPGIYDATTFKSACIQPPGVEVGHTSEDCLYLNIWAPVVNWSSSALPVMIHWHTGFWTQGSGVQYDGPFNMFDGTQLAAKGVIVVTINYRLGVFGFLFGDCESAPGNMGLWDQLTALKWVIGNINAFGGNPKDITIFGYSAGSMSLSCHSVSPITRNLFQKAILQSGVSYPKHRLSSKSDAFEFSRRFATNSDYFGDNACNDDKDFVYCLKSKSAEELGSANAKMWTLAQRYHKFFKPLYGDELVPWPLFEALRNGQFNPNTNFLIGHNELEGLSYKYTLGFKESQVRYNPKEPYIENISKNVVKRDISQEFVFIENRTVQLETAHLYTKTFSDNQSVLLRQQNKLKFSALSAFGDQLVACPIVSFGADIVVNDKFRANVFQYRVTYANSRTQAYGSTWASCSHGDDLPLMFGRPLNLLETFWTDNDRFISHHMVNIWAYFAKNGHPPPVNGQTWKPYTRAIDGSAIATYLELNPDLSHLGRLHVDRYKGSDGYSPQIINNCINYWKPIYINEYLNS